MMATTTLEWTDGNKDVTVTAERGDLYVTLDSPDVSFEDERGHLDTVKGRDVINCGTMEDRYGKEFRALVTLGGRRAEIEQLREDSEPEATDEPLAYKVEEYTKTSRASGWGEREITKQRLKPTKPHGEMTERQKELHTRVNTDRDVPDDAEAGDIIPIEDLLNDLRTREEKDQDALDEAADTGEEVVINKSTTDCNDPKKECNLDHVARVATPAGEIETRRTHTY